MCCVKWLSEESEKQLFMGLRFKLLKGLPEIYGLHFFL